MALLILYCVLCGTETLWGLVSITKNTEVVGGDRCCDAAVPLCGVHIMNQIMQQQNHRSLSVHAATLAL